VNFAGCKDGQRQIELMALSAPTPETERTTHYFFGFVRNFGLGDPDTERICAVDMVKVFNEDFPVLEAQQRNMDANLPRINIAVDAAPLAARRMLEGLLAKER
jgi:vanillate O-demethylase monooxygenase subunit